MDWKVSPWGCGEGGRGEAALHSLLRRLFLKCTGAMWGEGCVQPGWEGFGLLVGPSAPLPGTGELVATGVCPTCRATAAVSPALLWGAHSGAAAAPWASARVLCEPRARCWGSQDICQAHCPSSGSFFSSGGCMPSSPEARLAPSFLQPLPASAPGQLWANSPWHFLSGEQPLQPSRVVSSWQHSWGEFGLEMFVLACSWVLDFVCPGQRML